ncbi:MAG TPA: hypothetical protein VG326_19800 [Tepidisphaeraceae bacterium]|nr:hypothetical protein [Tepidisphaeraceae bacterium]
MLGLIKLAAYALLGYCMYEFYNGLMSGSSSSVNRGRGQMNQGMRGSMEREISGQSQPQSAGSR